MQTSPLHARCRACLAALVLSLLLAACGSADEPAGDVITNAEDTEEARYDFRVILAGAATDTLSGGATFGRVLNSRTGAQQFVIKMATGVDIVGGLFIVREDTARPSEDAYELANAAEAPDSVQAGAFYVSYQEGLLRQLKSREGTLTFSHVSDTLIAGTLDATLRGHVGTGRGGELRPGEIHLSGRFDAKPEVVGFVVGL